MTDLFTTMFRACTRLSETGIIALDAALRTMQSAIGRLAGEDPPAPPVDPPIDGPTTLDDATADLGNRLIRLAEMTLLQRDANESWNELVNAVRKSFGGLRLADPLQYVALPFQLPLSFGTLLTQQMLRLLYAADVVGPFNVPDFASYMAESFNDIQIITSLQYTEQIRRSRRHLERFPNDSAARMTLGTTYNKIGLYPQGVKELAEAAQDAALRGRALSESATANYRAGRFREAVQDAVSSLETGHAQDRTKYWLWLAAQKLGGYPSTVPEDFRIEVKAGRHTPKVEFEDVAALIGLDKTSAGRGTAVFDFDGDGHLDIVIASGHAGCSLYKNNGDGTFTDVTVGSGLEECVNSFIVAVGDYDNDGRDDLYITRMGFNVGDSVLFRNNGDGTFTDVTREAGVACWGPSFSAQWVDYDCDGLLDLFVASNLSGLCDRKSPNRLFHNNGDGTFTEVSEDAGLFVRHPTIGNAWGDFDNDGYPDLFLSSGLGRSQLFRNNRDGTFTDISREAGIDDVCFGSVCLWCDYDDDGWLDLVQFTWSPEKDMLHTLFHGKGPEHGQPMRIYHNNRDGTFTRLDRELGLDGCWGTMSGNAGDFNNDGYIDFLLGNGDPHMNRTEPSVILEMNGDMTYHNVTFAAGLPFTGKGHGANMADLAGDGRLCLIMASGGAYPGDLLTTSVYRPKTLPGNYLNVRLVGTRSNRNAIGARVRLDAGGRSQHRLVGGGSSFGCLPYEQHFGLADLKQVERLEIVWPGGLKQTVDHPPVNSTIQIVEGGD